MTGDGVAPAAPDCGRAGARLHGRFRLGSGLSVRMALSPEGPVVEVSGPLTGADAQALREFLLQVLHRRSARVVIDLVGVSNVDAYGVDVLVATHRRARLRDGELRLVVPSGQVRSALESAGVQHVVPLENPPAQS